MTAMSADETLEAAQASALPPVNPITVEVVRNAVNAYADEMAKALCKSAYNMMIYEVRDYCCGLIDTQARMISQNQRRAADLPRRSRRSRSRTASRATASTALRRATS